MTESQPETLPPMDTGLETGGLVPTFGSMHVAEMAAMIAHEANRTIQIALGEPCNPTWKGLDDYLKESTRNGIKGVLAGNTPQESHESWLAERAAAGWKYGPFKDAEKKEHPCFVAYKDLPMDQRAKDAMFAAVVRAVFGALRP